MVKVIEEAFYVGIQNVVGIVALDHFVKLTQRLMTTPSRPETHHLVIEHWFIDGLKYTPESFLHQFILVTIDAEWSCFPIILGNFNPPCRLRLIGLLFHPFHQVYKVFLKLPPVFLFGYSIDTYGFVSVHLLMTFSQEFDVDQMSNRGKHHGWILRR